ncbi:MAG: hypothetical protein HYT80_11395 [Euryarchaeota archaeon]|nr:hypothetical protein [Euryarchaeota archaeon]
MLVVGLLSVPFSGCMGGGRAFSLDSPDWRPGFSFAYSDEGDYSEKAHARAGDKEDKGEDAGHYGPVVQVFEVVNTTLGAAEEPAYLLVGKRPADAAGAEAKAAPKNCGPVPCPSVSIIENTLNGVRKADLQDLAVAFEARIEACNPSCSVELRNLRVIGGPDHRFLDFPLSRGKTWGGKVDGPSVNGGPPTGDAGVQMTARVGGATTVETPLGRIDAVHVEFRYELFGVDEIRRQLVKEAAEGGLKVEKFDLSVHSTRHVYYSEAYQAVVKTDYASDERVVLKVRSRDGERLEAEAESHVRGTRVLTGAHLIGRPERNLDEVARLLADQLPIADPTGDAYRPVDYSVDVSADQASVNAAEAPMVTFTTKVVGREALPDGHKVRWRVLGPMGTAVAEGTGTSFTHTIQEPGAYTAEVEAVDATGNVTSVDGASVVANFRKTIKVDCPNAGLEPTSRGCPTTPLPVRPGIARLKVDAKATGPLVAASSDRLQLRDTKNGAANDNTATAATYSIEVDDFSKWSVGAQDWTIQLYQQRAVLEDVEYTVDLDYGTQPATAKAGATGLPTFDALFATFTG